MVTVAQLAEHWIVVPRVVGSNPISHPKEKERSSNQGLLSFFVLVYKSYRNKEL